MDILKETLKIGIDYLNELENDLRTHSRLLVKSQLDGSPQKHIDYWVNKVESTKTKITNVKNNLPQGIAI